MAFDGDDGGGLDGVRVGHVDGHGVHLVALAGEPGGLFDDQILLEVEHQDLDALGAERLGDGQPDAACGAGDDRAATLQVLHRTPLEN